VDLGGHRQADRRQLLADRDRLADPHRRARHREDADPHREPRRADVRLRRAPAARRSTGASATTTATTSSSAAPTT
jgi:hypothetical protein